MVAFGIIYRRRANRYATLDYVKTKKMKKLSLQVQPNQMLTLERVKDSADSTQSELLLFLVTQSFRGKSSALVDAKQWAAFREQFDHVAKGESDCAELDTGRAGLSLTVYREGEAGSLTLVCNLRHPSFLGLETAIYATAAAFSVDKEELAAWLHEPMSDSRENG